MINSFVAKSVHIYNFFLYKFLKVEFLDQRVYILLRFLIYML